MKDSIAATIETSLSTDSEDPRASKAELVDGIHDATPDA